jgi:ArsR family transcriptional regulator
MSDINLKKMLSSAESACSLMKVLSNRDRMLILCELSQQEQCVSDLEQKLQIFQPTLSQQLTVLRKDKLVKTRREGKQIYYSLRSKEALAVMELLFQLFSKK